MARPSTGSPRSIAGSTALVTGAASGMGRATALLFAEEGAKVAVTDVDGDSLAEVVDEITAAGGTAIGWILDVRDGDAIKQVVDDVAERMDGLDIVVNNAGVSLVSSIQVPEFEDNWATSIDVLLTAQARIVRAALHHLRRSKAPRIVNISSTEGLGATPGISGYTAAKHGVIGLTKSLAVELGRDAITVNVVCPGPINTGMTAEIPDADKHVFATRRTALRRYGEPEEVAHMTLSLCLPAASFITGSVVVVDGGLTARNA
ncbi:MAG: SDR family oxidoreductase [Acidimicrobiia bacterium]|nr:SDR family oxidoreductase [Acidimicrobiia bacterium]